MTFQATVALRLGPIAAALDCGDILLVWTESLLCGLSIHRGETLWSRPVASPGIQGHERLWRLGEWVVVGKWGQPLYAVDPRSGDLGWTGPVTPGIDEIVSYGGALILLDRDWDTKRIDLHRVTPDGACTTITTPHLSLYGLLVGGGRLWLGGRDSLLRSNVDGLELFPVPVEVFAAKLLAATESLLYLRSGADRGRSIVAVELETGLERWRMALEPEHREFRLFRTAREERVLLVPPSGDELTVVDLARGEVVWKVQAGRIGFRSVTITGSGMLAIESPPRRDSVVVWLDPETGERSPMNLGLPRGSVRGLLPFGDRLLVDWRAPIDLNDHRRYLCEPVQEPAAPAPEPPPLAPTPPRPPAPPATLRPTPDETVALVLLFAEVMRASGDEQARRAIGFNERFTAWLKEHPDQSIGTFAARVALAGRDSSLHGVVLADLVRIRASSGPPG